MEIYLSKKQCHYQYFLLVLIEAVLLNYREVIR